MENVSRLGVTRSIRMCFCAVAVFLTATIDQQATAQNRRAALSASAAAPALPAPQLDETADHLLRRMSEYIGSAHQFTLQADITFDHVLPSGQKLQFSAVEQIALQRPTGLYVQWDGDLGNRQLWYDSKAVTIYDPATNFFATEAAPPTIDETLDKLIHRLDFTPPLSDFLQSDPYKSLRATIQYGFVVGDAQINGRSCRGLAFVEKHIDWQIWVDTGPQQVPCKLVITYKNDQSLPQFTALFTEWDLTPSIAAGTFTPDLPSTAKAIPFAAVQTDIGSK